MSSLPNIAYDRADIGCDPARFKKVRRAIRVSQVELSRASGVSQPFISRFEKGGTGMSGRTFDVLTVALSAEGAFKLEELRAFLLGERAKLTGSPIIDDVVGNST